MRRDPAPNRREAFPTEASADFGQRVMNGRNAHFLLLPEVRLQHSASDARKDSSHFE